ncbi:MAG: hypothetical protein AAGU21_15430 [Solidesulfovibrio sp.]|uniref:hypothetical protein n=1 Tax=Solidesulfovibrio sp. TaxID=2910990 RepID=UPI003158CAD2
MITVKVKRPRGRQDIWDALRTLAHKGVKLTDRAVADEAQCKDADVRLYTRCLTKAGFLALIPGEKPRAYILTRDNGREAPRVRRDGTVCPPTRRENMWRTMRRLGVFSATSLAVVASTEDALVKESDAVDYLKHLYRAGYLAVVQPAKDKGQGRTLYKLVKRTGGLPPQVLRAKTVYDPNTREIAWMDTREIEA